MDPNNINHQTSQSTLNSSMVGSTHHPMDRSSLRSRDLSQSYYSQAQPAPPQSSLNQILNEIQRGLSNLAASENQTISQLVVNLVNYYQQHIKKLKSLVFEKQQGLQINQENMRVLKRHLEAIKGQNGSMSPDEILRNHKFGELRTELIFNEKEVARLREELDISIKGHIEARRDKVQLFSEMEQKVRDIDILKHEITLKNDDLDHFNRKIELLSQDKIDQREEIQLLKQRIDELEMNQPKIDQHQLQIQTKNLLDEINDLKLELHKAKRYVESSKYDSAIHRSSSRGNSSRRRHRTSVRREDSISSRVVQNNEMSGLRKSLDQERSPPSHSRHEEGQATQVYDRRSVSTLNVQQDGSQVYLYPFFFHYFYYFFC